MTLPDPARTLEALAALVKDRESRHADTGARFLDKIQAEIDTAAAKRLDALAHSL